MKLKLLASVLVLAVAFTGVLGATAAYFSDTEQSTTTVAAGTLDLTIGNAGATIPATIENMVPGQTKEVLVAKLKNKGSIDGKIIFKDMLLTEDENGVTEPEVGDTDETGELGGKLTYTVKFYKSLLSVFGADDVDFSLLTEADIVSTLQLSLTEILSEEFSSLFMNLPTLRPNEYCYAVIDVSWVPSDSDNMAQSDKVVLNGVFELSQVH